MLHFALLFPFYFPETTPGFVCESEGHFPDLNDTTCLGYFQCDRLNDGTFSKKPLKCMESVFCPSTQKCSPEKVCPCKHTTTSESLSSSKPPVATANTENVPSFCTSNVSADFKCESVGRFPNFNDRTCQAYFLCSHLQNGSFIKTEYTCRNSFFDPDIKRCTLSYVCPCRTSETTSTEMSTTVSHVDNATTTTEFLTTQTGCAVSSKEFQCASEGRFPDHADVTCRNYFLCSKLRNGTFIKTQYQCLRSTFNPLMYKCSSSYMCPCSTLTTPSSTISTTLSYTNSTAAPTVRTSIDTFPTTLTASSTIGCKIPNSDFECAIAGRFPDNSDVTCTKYFLCSKLNNGTFIKTSYKCLNAAFNSLTLKCSVNYICPCNVDDTSVATTSTTVSEAYTTSSTPTTTMSHTCLSSSQNVPEFTCSKIGRYPDYNDVTCTKYFLCSKLNNGTFIKTVYACLNSVFDPSILRCSISYKCPCKIYTTSTTLTEGVTTVSTTTIPSYICRPTAQDVPEFTCGRIGRFPDFTDITCSKYFLCSKLRNGTFIKTSYTCVNSVFDPSTGKCSISYECPCKIETTSVPTPFTTLSEGVTPIFTTTTPSYTCGNTSPGDSEFMCVITGRFPDFTDMKCAKYFLCSKLRNGTFIQTEYTCINSSFDPSILRCSLSYKCPCVIDTTSSTTTSISTSTTTSYDCLTTSKDDADFTCTKIGRFPDYKDVDCRKYFLCSKLYNGTFIKTQYTCSNSTFDPSTYTCSRIYECPCKVNDLVII